MNRGLILSLMLTAGAGSAAAQAVVTERAALQSGSNQFDADFGSSVALLGQHLFVGMPDLERVQVFQDSGSGYVFLGQLTASDGGQHDDFGHSVAAAGARCVVGAPYHGGGAAYVFAFDGSAWTFEQKLVASDVESFDGFGLSVACGADRIVVGAPGADVPGQLEHGAAYVFDRSGTSWAESAILTGPDSVGGDRFGYGVALDAELLVVCARGADAGYPDSGAAYAFRDTGSGFAFEHKFLPPASGAGWPDFAPSIDVEGERVAFGIPNGGAAGEGIICIFERTLGVWDSGFVCTVPYGVYVYQLGASVALHGDRVVGGAIYNFVAEPWSGSAVVFQRVGSVWLPELRLIPSNSFADSGFGAAVAFDGTRIAVGAPQWTVPPNMDERVYLYDLVERVGTASCAGDGSLAPCPCSNESDSALGFGCENGLGRGANLAASGTPSVGADDLVLSVEHLTHGSGYPLSGMYTQLLAGAGLLLPPTTFGDGLRCVNGAVARVGPAQLARSGGIAIWGPQLGAQLGWVAGQTLHFQVVYRDAYIGGCGSHVNSSNALSVSFTP